MGITLNMLHSLWVYFFFHFLGPLIWDFLREEVKIPRLKLVTFCRKMSNVCWWSFADQLHPHHMLGSKVTWVTTASCCYIILGNIFLDKWRQQSPTFCKGLNISRMQAFVRLPTEFDNLLLNAAGYFDVSPLNSILTHPGKDIHNTDGVVNPAHCIHRGRPRVEGPQAPETLFPEMDTGCEDFLVSLYCINFTP